MSLFLDVDNRCSAKQCCHLHTPCVGFLNDDDNDGGGGCGGGGRYCLHHEGVTTCMLSVVFVGKVLFTGSG